MQIGMLWLDDSKKRPFDEKVKRAAEYYHDKYGRLPELCLVNAQMLKDGKTVGRIEVKPAKTVLLNHFWLGMKVS